MIETRLRVGREWWRVVVVWEYTSDVWSYRARVCTVNWITPRGDAEWANPVRSEGKRNVYKSRQHRWDSNNTIISCSLCLNQSSNRDSYANRDSKALYKIVRMFKRNEIYVHLLLVILSRVTQAVFTDDKHNTVMTCLSYLDHTASVQSFRLLCMATRKIVVGYYLIYIIFYVTY